MAKIREEVKKKIKKRGLTLGIFKSPWLESENLGKKSKEDLQI